MKKILSYILTTTALLASCASEDFTVSEGTPSTTTTNNTITVLADRQDFLCGDNTRAAYSGVSMAFENGDRIGLYAVNGTTVVSSNVCFTFNGTEWTSTTDVTYNADYDYYAYYPYVASPYTPAFTQSGLKAKFQLFIDDASNKFHQADQSTKAAFNASDLCIAQAVHVSPHVVRFSFEHKKGLAVFNGTHAATATFSGDNIPYATDDAKYYIMKDATATTFTDDVDGSYSLYASSGKYVTHSVSAYLTFVARENGTFSFSEDGLSYSLDDGETWTALSAGANTPTVTAGNKIIWKNNTSGTHGYGIGTFSSSGTFEAEGNIMSLYYGDNAIGKENLIDNTSNTFMNLFKDCTGLTKVKRSLLPSTTLAGGCYYGMFQGCTSLTTAPELPATTLTNYCYYGMFQGCTSLTTPPVLPATTVAQHCYQQMFMNCTSLTSVPALPAETIEEYCYASMFGGCTSLTVTPALPATTMVTGCYSSMFGSCTSLTTAPALPAETLAQSCYSSMFKNCTSLTTAPTLSATTLAYWCYSYMFEGCTALTTAPELPATMLVSSCYNKMFYGCSSLNYVKAAFTTSPASYSYTDSWLYGVAAEGTFYKNAAAGWNFTSASGIPSGWTVETYTP